MRRDRRIRRRYDKPFFSSRRRPNGLTLLLFIGAIFCAGLGLFALFATQFDRLQYAAQDLLGIAPTPTPFASQHAGTGIRLYTAGDVSGALTAFGLALDQQPDNIDYLYEYGVTLIELGDSAAAAEIGDRAIAAAPGDERAYALKARALMWSAPGNAIPIAVSGLDYNPNFAPLHGVLAVAYTNIGRYDEGLRSGSRAIQLDPLNAFAHRAYSIPLIYTGRNRQAIEALEQAVGINPNLSGPYFELAAQYRAIDFPEMAVGIYRRVLEIEPDNAKAYLRLCETYAAVGEFQEGSRFCEKALTINPEYGSAWRMLGQLQYSRRNYEGAIESFLNCIAFGSDEVECYYIRGLAHYILGQCDDAWRVLNEALDYASQDPIIETINIGLGNIRVNCSGYEAVSLPTPAPPTPIPPTPIGGI